MKFYLTEGAGRYVGYRIQFHYPRIFDPRPPGKDVPDGTTVCWISVDDAEGHPCRLAEGIAMLHPNDHFVRETGRKVALAKALQSMNWSRDQRRTAWRAYHGRKRYADDPLLDGKPLLDRRPLTPADIESGLKVAQDLTGGGA